MARFPPALVLSMGEVNMEKRSYRAYTQNDLPEIARRVGLSSSDVEAMRAVAAVLPFRVNSYVVEDLIQWDDIPDDPIFQLTFPQRGMLEERDFERMRSLIRAGASSQTIEAEAARIRRRLNPHPAGQMDLNVPRLDGRPLRGMQHKYRETVLFFPGAGQTCHAYCTYCFRWAQFVGEGELRFAEKEAQTLVAYLHAHPEVTDVLVTGGDPMVMRARVLRRFLEPLLDPALEHVRDIRIGTKSLAWWPFRFLSDPDADEVLELFERIVASGRHLAIMAHYSHYHELETRPAQEALQRVLATGAVVRCQAPLVRHVNDSADVWSTMWARQVALGAIPYYMFVERDTGARGYFEIPLARAHEIFRNAYRRVSGLARTVRGPSMSATPGKVQVCGTARVRGEKVFVLQFLQARDPDWVGRPFFARFDARATWLDQLQPAFGEPRFLFEEGYESAARRRLAWRPAWRPSACLHPNEGSNID